MELRKFALWSTLLIIILLIVVIWFYPSNSDFNTKSSLWNGAEEFSNNFGATTTRSLEDLPENPDNSILVVIPYTEFSQTDLAALKQYVSSGGTLVLANDYGYGNTVLDYLQIDASFNGTPLLDPLFNYKNSYFPKVTDFTSSALTNNITSIVLNHATSIKTGAGVKIIAQSSAASFLDLNNNQLCDENEPTGPMAVVAQTNLNKGLVILLSDPSIIINSMQDTNDNHAFISNIIKVKGPDSDIMLDESHLSKSNLDEAQSRFANIRDKLATPAGITLTVTIIVALALLPIWFKAKGGKHGRIFKRRNSD